MSKKSDRTALEKEILAVFKDTNRPVLDGTCNISFRAFLVANYTEDCLRTTFPILQALLFKLTRKELIDGL